jgi:hypothetical protein
MPNQQSKNRVTYDYRSPTSLIIYVHDFTHLPPLSQSFSLQTSNFIPCIPELYDQYLEGGINRGSGDVYEFNRILSNFTLTFVFPLNRSFVHDLNRLPNSFTFTFIFLWDKRAGYDICFSIFLMG